LPQIPFSAIMIRNMDTQTLIVKIDASEVLTAKEKTYWKENLQYMTSGQMDRLDKVLNKAKTISWSDYVSKFVNALGTSAQSYLSSHPA
jgi:hypothetical protein